jgi:DNA-binding NtrC family response regulator
VERPFAALVVDASEPIRTLLTAFFKHSGFAVDSEGTVDGALAKLRQSSFDVVVVDPFSGSDGVAMHRIAADFPEMLGRTIVIGSRPMPAITEAVHSVVEKPFELATLLQAALACARKSDLREA